DVRPMTPDIRRQAQTELMSGVLFLKVIDKYDLAETWKVLNRTVALEEMKRRVTVFRSPSDGTLEIVAEDLSREGAARLANAIAEEFVDQKNLEAELAAEDKIRDLSRELEDREDLVSKIELQLRDLEGQSLESDRLRDEMVQQTHLIRSLEARHQLAIIESREAGPAVSLLSEAIADEASLVEGRWYLPVVLGLVGFLLGAAIVCLSALRGTPIQVAMDLREKLELLLIGFAPIPSTPLARLNRVSDSIVEPYRFLRHAIQKLPAGDCSLISFVSGDLDSEMPSVASNLSVVMAEAGHTVLLIDGDLREPQLFELFDAANHPGLSDYLTGEMRLEETVVKTRRNNLWFMPSGPSREDPSGLFSGKRMEDLIYDMKSRFDYLLITSPSPLSYSEAGVISGLVDHTIAVTSYKRHSEKKLKQLKQALEAAGGLLSGIALSQQLAPPPEAREKKSKAANAVSMDRENKTSRSASSSSHPAETENSRKLESKS
ncbi:MAG: hypothetical protein AAF733_08210, partial [Verrucomicrobiota bacterium]